MTWSPQEPMQLAELKVGMSALSSTRGWKVRVLLPPAIAWQ